MKTLDKRFRAWWRSLHRLDEQPVPETDPVVGASLATPLAVTSLLLVVTLVWALHQEVWGLRPWKSYQEDFVPLYRKVLKGLEPATAEEMERLQASTEYQELARRLRETEEAVRPQLAALEDQEALVRGQLAAITPLFTTERSRIQAKIYELETSSEAEREDLREELKRLQEGPYAAPLAGVDGNPDEGAGYTFSELEAHFETLKTQQGQIQMRKVDLLRGPSELRRELEDYVKARMTGLTQAQINGLLSGLDQFKIEIRQIHNPEMGLVDRCESCHLGIREPVDLTLENMDGRLEFCSHPNRELLESHDPEVFGCSPCHNGNGVGTVSVDKAHGRYKHWLWPLYARENTEAGCLQCHEGDRQLRMAPTLNEGKQLFWEKGCWGCHPREGFDTERRLIRDTQKTVQELLSTKELQRLEIERTLERGDQAETNEEATRLYAEAEAMTMGIADIDARLAGAEKYLSDLMMEVKTVGPSLKEARNKLKGEWIPVWLRSPQEFRPGTKMPRFRLEEEQVRAIAAFIWQSALRTELTAQPVGDPQRGKLLFETRGCMACHAVGEAEQAVGGRFAANLSRVGEKANYNYLVRWVHNPRERSAPYCPTHERDLTEGDYRERGLAFEFDLEHDRCPLGDHELQVQQPTIMPSLRLSWEESRDVAAYLTGLRRADAQYEQAPYLEDPALFETGKALVRHFGCAGCHEIAGLEQAEKIGTDLTQEGSKPIERLDFALLTHEAKREGWYNHKGFFERKLTDPALFDRGKIKAPLDRLRMPEPVLTAGQIDALTTYLLGSVDTVIPEQFFYRPSGPARDIQEGWWIVSKYNCMACHQLTPGQETVLEQMPRYQSPEGKDQRPPSLVGEGARVNPDWLSRFLKNPSLSDTQIHRNGVRPYLAARMPTFNLSDDEVQKLVRFFAALSEQPLPYLPAETEPLTREETLMARGLFTHPAAPCLKCHATGDPVRDRAATAPSFVLVQERLKPDWTRRWIVGPEIIRPGTAMPSGLFRWDGSRWVFATADVPGLRDYPGDHAELIVRYMFRFTAEEQRRLRAR